MTTMSNSPEVELLHSTWEAMSGGDFAVLEDALAADAQWLGVEDGQLCENRKAILEVMRRNLPGRLQGRIEETIQVGERHRRLNPRKVREPAWKERCLSRGGNHSCNRLRSRRGSCRLVPRAPMVGTSVATASELIALASWLGRARSRSPSVRQGSWHLAPGESRTSRSTSRPMCEAAKRCTRPRRIPAKRRGAEGVRGSL
jgi:hypothetical protein